MGRGSRIVFERAFGSLGQLWIGVTCYFEWSTLVITRRIVSLSVGIILTNIIIIIVIISEDASLVMFQYILTVATAAGLQNQSHPLDKALSASGAMILPATLAMQRL